MQTHLISLQYALFFKEVVDRPDIEFSKLNEKMLNLFDGIPSINDVPRQLPNDIPLVALKNEEGSYTCNIARSRIDLHFQKLDADDSNTECLNDFNVKVKAFVNYVLSVRDVNRFGMVARYFSEDTTATHTLKKKYFSGAINDPEELSLRFNEITKLKNIDLNDIVEIGKQEIKIRGESKKGLIIQRDINNRPYNKSLSLDLLSEISKQCSRKVSESGIEALVK